MEETIQLAFDFGPILPLLTPDEIYQRADQALLVSLKEDKRLERKSASISPESCAEYLSMFANTVPDGGIIIIGLSDNGSVIGCTNVGVDKINNLEKIGVNYCPDAIYTTKKVPVTNSAGQDDFLLLIKVSYHETKVVRTSKNEAFIRMGDSKYKLSDHQIRELEIDKGQIDFELEPCTLIFPTDFDSDLLRLYTSKYKETRSLTLDHSTEEILEFSHLGRRTTKGFIPNNACALLFAKTPRSIFPGCKIRFLRYDGEDESSGDKWNVVKDITIDTGSVPRLILAIEQVLEAQIRTFSHLANDGIFYTMPEYPKMAWYEAIVNACVHRSYAQKNMNIFVKMFDDRLVVESPGGVPTISYCNEYI